MASGNIYKPRNKISFITKSKARPDKNGYFRHFFALRGRQFFRKQSLFIRCRLVAKSMKWLSVRRSMRPSIIWGGIRRIKPASDNKTAFGRPLKQRYRDRFYKKQQLRFFHGEIKEKNFRNFFKTHLKSVSLRTKSLFSGLESRLDMVFFRIRLLPTIFACRQFINHQGLEVNAKLQKAPRSLIATGDVVALPQKTWKAFYFSLFQRIYYRRWGRYIKRRRLFKQRKKVSYFARRRFRWRVKRRQFNRNKLRFFYNKRTVTINNLIGNKATVARLFASICKKQIYIDGTIKTQEPFFNERFIVKQSTKKLLSQIGSTDLLRLFTNHSQGFYALFDILNTDSKNKHNLSANNLKSISECTNMLTSFVHLTRRIVDQLQTSKGVSSKVFIDKVLHYQKIGFSSRFRKIMLPRSFRYVAGKKKKIGYYFSKRNSLMRFYLKKHKKSVHNKKRVRLKGVHFFIPNYLQIDFRTLRVIKIQSPSEEEIFYPFRISLPKRYSFYRSKGF